VVDFVDAVDEKLKKQATENIEKAPAARKKLGEGKGNYSDG